MRYSAWFDVDGMPLAFIQSDRPYITVQRYGADSVAWTQHRTVSGAVNRATRDKTTAYEFNGIYGRWEEVSSV
jgi:hypothetical protein